MVMERTTQLVFGPTTVQIQWVAVTKKNFPPAPFHDGLGLWVQRQRVDQSGGQIGWKIRFIVETHHSAALKTI